MSKICISCKHHRRGQPERSGYPEFLTIWITTEPVRLVMTTDRDNTRLISKRHLKEYITNRVHSK